MRNLAPLLPVVLLLALSACGGGGSSDPTTVETFRDPEPFLLSGDFHIAIHLQAITGQATMVGVGTPETDGALLGSLRLNDGGMVTPDPLPLDTTWQTMPDGTFRWPSGLGGASPDGRVVATYFPGGLNLLVRREGTFDATSLSGTYRFGALFGAPLSGSLFSFGGTIVFDGSDAWAMSVDFVNEEGVHAPAAGAPTGTYAITAAGDVEFNTPTLRLTGGLGLDGELLILAGGADDGQPPMLLYAVREGAGHDASSLQGDYNLVLHRLAPMTHDRIGKLGVLTVAAGAAEWQATYPDLALGLPLIPQPVAYLVSPEGRVDLALDGQDYQGALSASGDVALFVGGVTDGDDPALLALVRKAEPTPTNQIALNVLHSASIDETRGVYAVGDPDQLRVVFSSRRLEIGEDRVTAAFFTTEGLRAPIRFDLNGLRPDATVARATLVTSQDAVQGSPFSSLGALVVDHVDLGSTLTRSDFDPTRLALGTIGTLSEDASLGPRSLDVTAAVLADLAAGKSTSDYLLHFSLEENGDPVLDRVVFDDHTGPGPSLGPRTRLQITYR